MLLTSEVEEVVVLEAVDGLQLAADIVLLSRVEQVPDSRVLVVSAEDLLGLEGSISVYQPLFLLCNTSATITQALGMFATGAEALCVLTCLACRRPRP